MEAIREELRLAELSKKYGVHPNMISGWKRAAVANLAQTFERGKSDEVRHLRPKSRSCIRRSGSWSWNGFFWRAPRVNCSGRPKSLVQKMVSADHELSQRRQCALLRVRGRVCMTGQSAEAPFICGSWTSSIARQAICATTLPRGGKQFL